MHSCQLRTPVLQVHASTQPAHSTDTVDFGRYRRNVGICLFNSQGQVLAAQRADSAKDSWQFPQGVLLCTQLAACTHMLHAHAHILLIHVHDCAYTYAYTSC